MNTDGSGPDGDFGEDLEPAIQEAVAQAFRDTVREENAGRMHASEAERGNKRQRVVLAKRRSSRPVVRTLTELEDQTSVGEALASQLVRLQLMLSLRQMLLAVVVLISIPLVFLWVPSLGSATILGLRLPWLLLGLAVYPFFVAVAWSYNRSADRNEQDFADWVEN
jgi:Flp pilus assembly protein TadB